MQYRHQKHVQYELTQDSLEVRRETLDDLEKSEAEARRLEAALAAAGVRPKAGSIPPSGRGPGRGDEAVDDDDETDLAESSSSLRRNGAPHLPPTPVVSPRRSKSMGSGLLSALSHSIHGMMDVDPEAARRSTISKTRDAISHVRPLRSSLEHLLRIPSAHSWRMLNTSLHKILNMRRPPYKQTLTGSSVKRWQT